MVAVITTAACVSPGSTQRIAGSASRNQLYCCWTKAPRAFLDAGDRLIQRYLGPQVFADLPVAQAGHRRQFPVVAGAIQAAHLIDQPGLPSFDPRARRCAHKAQAGDG